MVDYALKIQAITLIDMIFVGRLFWGNPYGCPRKEMQFGGNLFCQTVWGYHYMLFIFRGIPIYLDLILGVFFLYHVGIYTSSYGIKMGQCHVLLYM